MNFTTLQKKIIGQGAAVLLVGMFAGIGLLISLLGGIELIPGSIIEFGIPGDTGACVRAHVGGMLNGMLIILVAAVMVGSALPRRPPAECSGCWWVPAGPTLCSTGRRCLRPTVR